jgi:hypothetical protein
LIRWIKAAFRAAWEDVRDSTKRVAAFFGACTRNAFKRWWVLPLAAGATVAVAMVSPFFSAGLIALVVNDPEAHPLWRMLLDVGAVGAAVVLVMFVPLLAIPLAVLPIADVMNRWLDSVVRHYEELEREDNAAHAGLSAGQRGDAPVAVHGTR